MERTVQVRIAFDVKVSTREIVKTGTLYAPFQDRPESDVAINEAEEAVAGPFRSLFYFWRKLLP